MKVKDVMHHDATWVGPDTPLPQVAARILEEHAGVLPISEFDRLVGVVTARDIGACDAEKAQHMRARDVMSKAIVYCYPEEEAEEAACIMRKHAVRRLTVVSHQKRIVGSVLLEDVESEPRMTANARHGRA
jgi:CBS domain-containing protein